jgi:hypothetical protein
LLYSLASSAILFDSAGVARAERLDSDFTFQCPHQACALKERYISLNGFAGVVLLFSQVCFWRRVVVVLSE